MLRAAPLLRCAAALRSALPPPPHAALRPHVASRRACADSAAAIYDRPSLYDVAFSLRDFEAQTAFMLRLAETHGGAPATSFLELACGPGRHTRAAARKGLRATGLDRSAAMLAYARQQQAAELQSDGGGAGAAFVEGDMTRLRRRRKSGAAAEDYDVIACLLGSFTHLLSNAAALRCLRGCARLLSPRGVVVLELPPPWRLFDGSAAHAARPARGLDASGAADNSFEVPSWDVGDEAAGLHVAVQWGAPGDAFCALTQVLRRTVTLTAWQDDGGSSSSSDSSSDESSEDGATSSDDSDNMDAFLARPPVAELVEVVPSRFYTLPELQLLAKAAGLRVAALHGELADNAPADASDAHALVVVLTHAANEEADDDDEQA